MIHAPYCGRSDKQYYCILEFYRWMIIVRVHGCGLCPRRSMCSGWRIAGASLCVIGLTCCKLSL